jgi:hypothetical protein
MTAEDGPVHTVHDAPPRHGPDAGAAFAGLIVGAIVLFSLLFSIVHITNAHYERIEASQSQAK